MTHHTPPAGADYQHAAQTCAQQIVSALQGHTHRGLTEKHMQNSIECVFRAAGFKVSREHRLCERDRPDFLINGTVVVEVKMRASGGSVLAQLARYAQHSNVRAIVVACPRFSSLGVIPERIHGVPVYVAALPGTGLML